MMPFHDCSALSSSNSKTSDSVFQCGSIELASPVGLMVAHLNCRSLLSVANEVYDLFAHQCIDIFAATETWLDSSIAYNEISLYFIYHNSA